MGSAIEAINLTKYYDDLLALSSPKTVITPTTN
jgi:hypothetical protein